MIPIVPHSPTIPGWRVHLGSTLVPVLWKLHLQAPILLNSYLLGQLSPIGFRLRKPETLENAHAIHQHESLKILNPKPKFQNLKPKTLQGPNVEA